MGARQIHFSCRILLITVMHRNCNIFAGNVNIIANQNLKPFMCIQVVDFRNEKNKWSHRSINYQKKKIWIAQRNSRYKHRMVNMCLTLKLISVLCSINNCLPFFPNTVRRVANAKMEFWITILFLKVISASRSYF